MSCPVDSAHLAVRAHYETGPPLVYPRHRPETVDAFARRGGSAVFEHRSTPRYQGCVVQETRQLAVLGSGALGG